MPASERILVFRPGALGDTLLAIDALAALRQRFPEARLELVGNAEAGQLLCLCGLVNEVTSFDSAEVTGLFLEPPQLPGRWFGARLVVLWMQQARALAEALRRARAELVLVARPEPEEQGVHVADHLVRTLAPAGVRPLAGPVSLEIPAQCPAVEQPPLVLLHPGSGASAKNWPAERFADLATRFRGCAVASALLCGPADHEAVREVLAGLAGHGIPVIEPPDVIALAETLRRGGLFVGNDSGVSHLAGRLGVPTVTIFGTTDPQRWAPRGPYVRGVGKRGAWPSVDEVWEATMRVGLFAPWRSELVGQLRCT